MQTNQSRMWTFSIQSLATYYSIPQTTTLLLLLLIMMYEQLLKIGHSTLLFISTLQSDNSKITLFAK